MKPDSRKAKYHRGRLTSFLLKRAATPPITKMLMLLKGTAPIKQRIIASFKQHTELSFDVHVAGVVSRGYVTHMCADRTALVFNSGSKPVAGNHPPNVGSVQD